MIDATRHAAIFDPVRFNMSRKEIDVIGCGAIGSHIGRSLYKLGLEGTRYWDPDHVEEHNIANQSFCEEYELGEPKADALALAPKDKGLVQLYEGQKPLRNYVFLCVDSMKARQEIFENNIQYKAGIDLVIDCRIDPWMARIYTLDPKNTNHVDMWDQNMYEDEERNESLCGTRQTLGPTAQIVANMAVLNFIKHVNNEPEYGEILLSLKPFSIYTNKLES